MRKLLTLAACAVLTASLAGTASAEALRGRLAVTGKVGITNPADSERNHPDGKLVVDSDVGIIGGGGILYGVDDNVALEIDITRSSYHTSGFGTAQVTNLSVGGQYRFPERNRLVPYIGVGADVLINDLSGSQYVDTTLGVHLAGGLDYMAMRQVAYTMEIKGIQSYSTDVRDGGTKIGDLDPSSLSLTFGVRFFFN